MMLPKFPYDNAEVPEAGRAGQWGKGKGKRCLHGCLRDPGARAACLSYPGARGEGSLECCPGVRAAGGAGC